MFNLLISLSATVLTAWMLIDASRRRVEAYWYFIILTPLGEWVYFLAIKIHDYDLSRWSKILRTPPTVAVLERLCDETPSVENRLRLGQALYDNQKYEAAEQLFAEVLKQTGDDREAAYGVALCQVNREDYEAAVRALARLIEGAPAYADYDPWFDLAFAYWKWGKRPEAIEVLERLVQHAPRPKHSAILGRYLARHQQNHRAREVLEEVVDDYRASSGHAKRVGGRWASEARRTLRDL